MSPGLLSAPVPSPAAERAFLASVVYAAVFDYPLTLEQLHESLIELAAAPDDLRAWYWASPFLQTVVEYHEGYFFPRGRRDLLELRQKREAISRRVLQDLGRPLALVLNMPFVRMVALSGSLAHLNADGEADLDLFVVTRGGRVWGVTTTLLALSRLFGWRRRLCLNYVISERQLAVQPRDLFSANQIVHLRPLGGADVYRRFLEANRFVAEFYPNFTPRAAGTTSSPWWRVAAERVLDVTVAPLYERACRAAYSWHLERQRASWQSRDQVRLEAECLKLHTSSHRQTVMDRFERSLADAERVRSARGVRAQAGR